MIDSKKIYNQNKTRKAGSNVGFSIYQDYVRFVSSTPPVAPSLLILAPFL